MFRYFHEYHRENNVNDFFIFEKFFERHFCKTGREYCFESKNFDEES